MLTPRDLPVPVRAAVGLLARGADRLARPPAELLILPLRAAAAARRTYDELARHGEEVLTRRRTGGRGRERAEEAARPRAQAQASAPAVAPAAREAPTPAPAAVRREPNAAPRFELPEDVRREVAEAPPGATLAHDELPLADYDHLTLGSLRARLTKLDPVGLVQIRDYERAHANRLPVLTMLDNRIAKLTGAAEPAS